MEDEGQIVYPFPYYLLPEKAKIVLYGAGKMGSSYYEQLQRDGRIDVVQWIDKNYQVFDKTDRPVVGINQIKETVFDFVLIAIADRNAATEAMEELEKIGVNHRKIIWSGIAGNAFMQEQFIYRASKLYRKVMGWLAKEPEYPRFFLFLAPEHGNLGDEAILLAEREFFQCYFPDRELLEITEWEWENFYLLGDTKLISDKDIIFIQGGGNFGNMWENGKWIHQIVDSFSHNKIIMLPNTLTYRDNDEEAMKEDAVFYRKHQNLYLFAREKDSYEKMRRLQYREDAYLGCYPDMVLWGKDKHFSEKENTALLCMRADEEKSLSSESVDKIKAALGQRGITFKETSTLLMKAVFGTGIEKAVDRKLMEFSRASFVVTDRLHGMIFAAITGVPCIAFNNSTGKVKGVYQWIKELPYIYYIETGDEFENCLDNVANPDTYSYNAEIMRKELGKMAERIREIME